MPPLCGIIHIYFLQQDIPKIIIITPSIAAMSHRGNTSAKNTPVTKNIHPMPNGRRFLYILLPPIFTTYYAPKHFFVTV